MDTTQLLKQIHALRDGLAALEHLVLEKQPHFPEEKRRQLQEGICLNCGEPLEGKKGRPVRGVDQACYRQIKRMIADGELTDDEAVTRGILDLPDITGRPKKETAARRYVRERGPKNRRSGKSD